MVYDYETRKKIARLRSNKKIPPNTPADCSGCAWVLVILLTIGAVWMALSHMLTWAILTWATAL